jgi:hypothetical protein
MKANLRASNQEWKLGVLFVCALLTSAVPNAWAQEQVASQRLQPKTYHPKPPDGLNSEQIKTDQLSRGGRPPRWYPIPGGLRTVSQFHQTHIGCG